MLSRSFTTHSNVGTTNAILGQTLVFQWCTSMTVWGPFRNTWWYQERNFNSVHIMLMLWASPLQKWPKKLRNTILTSKSPTGQTQGSKSVGQPDLYSYKNCTFTWPYNSQVNVCDIIKIEVDKLTSTHILRRHLFYFLSQHLFKVHMRTMN